MSETRVKRPPQFAPAAGELKALRITAVSLAAGALLVIVAGSVAAPRQTAFSYLVAFLFLVSLAVGGLFWVLLHYLSGAVWSVVLRRLMEHLAGLVFPAAVLFLPLLLALDVLFDWSADVESLDAAVAGKTAYLNVPFFLVRAGCYFAIWLALAYWFRRASLRQDVAPPRDETSRVGRLSAVGLLLLAVTTTFASFDWIMSLDPHWYSNIFGVYFWSGSILASLAALTLLALTAHRFLGMSEAITVEHLHDLGKLLFGFTVFWAYIAFSQYFLIWYAAIPEETTWYAVRLRNGWGVVSMLLAVCQFVVPFVLLLPRAPKRSPLILGLAAAWILASHALDLHWQVMPTLHPEGVAPHWVDAATLLLVLAVALGTIAEAAKGKPLIPQRDPDLFASIRFESE